VFRYWLAAAASFEVMGKIGILIAAAVLWSLAGAASSRDLLGLPGTPPSADPERLLRATLGEKLFHDARLSADGTVSCATCHQPDRAFADGLPVAKGTGGRRGTRNTPSLLNVAFQRSLFWDGRRDTLEQQARDPFFHPREHGLPNEQALLERLRSDPDYAASFFRLYGTSSTAIRLGDVVDALTCYERTLLAGNSPFDRYYYGGEEAALSKDARRGLALFEGRAQCASCHTLDQDSALFTDHQFHSVALGHKKIESRVANLAATIAKASQAEQDRLVLEDADYAELGRFLATRNPADIGKFKTPSLRNVAATGPYMHDGSVSTLEEALDLEIYYRRLNSNHAFVLTPQDKSDLLAFLKSLTSPGVRASLSSP
jgi:cytochrome c peroxidase